MALFFPLILVFWAGYFFNETLFWVHWVGFARLCFLYQKRRHGNFFKDFFLPCLGVFLAVYAVCFYWVLIGGFWIYLYPVLVISPIFPLIFLSHHLLTAKARSPLLQVVAAFGVFFIFESLMTRVPAMESIGFDFFFQPPTAMLCVLKYIQFKGWSAWVFAACFASALWFRERKPSSLLLLGALIGAMAALFFFAQAQNKSFANSQGPTVKVALVQHNLPYLEGWRRRHYDEIRQKYRELALKASLGSPDLVVFPLYNLPGDVYREPSFLKELAAIAKSPILIGSHVPIHPGDEFHDQGLMSLAFLYAPDGKLMDIYQAVETPPFYPHYAKRAETYRAIKGSFGKLGVLLCFEDMVPRLTRDAVRRGARVLISLSNPGLFAQTSIIYYELLQDQIRAAEAGLPLLRLSPNGHSALIDRTGKIVQKTKLDTEDVLQVEFSDLGPDGIGGEEPVNPWIDANGQPLHS